VCLSGQCAKNARYIGENPDNDPCIYGRMMRGVFQDDFDGGGGYVSAEDIRSTEICRSRIRLTSIAADDTHLCYLIRPSPLCYMGEACGKRVQVPHGRATVSGDESQQDEPLAGAPLGRRWRVG
jgi:hypothetical protein